MVWGRGVGHFRWGTVRHRGEDERVGGRMSVRSHRGVVYQKISDMHKADRTSLSTLKDWMFLTIKIRMV